MKAFKLENNNEFSLLDMIEYPVVVTTINTEVVYANHSVIDLLGSDCIGSFLSQALQVQDGGNFTPSYFLLNRRQPIRCIFNKCGVIKYLDTYIKASKQNGKHFFVISFVDVTAYVERENALFKEATIDSLTSIYNRKHFFFQFDNELKRSTRDNSDIALLLFDIDHFKNVNDVYGHAAGDKVLQEITRVIKQELRDIDIFGRLGGEEFGVVLPKANIKKANNVANRLRQIIGNNHISVVSTNIKVTISIGVISITGYAPSDHIMQQADKALYCAKNNGRDTVCCQFLQETHTADFIYH